MSYSAASDAALQRAIDRYADAVDRKAFEGTVPYVGEDIYEQGMLDAVHEDINHELNYSRQLLERLIERRVNGL